MENKPFRMSRFEQPSTAFAALGARSGPKNRSLFSPAHATPPPLLGRGPAPLARPGTAARSAPRRPQEAPKTRPQRPQEAPGPLQPSPTPPTQPKKPQKRPQDTSRTLKTSPGAPQEAQDAPKTAQYHPGIPFRRPRNSQRASRMYTHNAAPNRYLR